MPNFLEQLIAEWYEFRGYFVRRNINVGKRAKGGYECELDVVAFSPRERRLVHIEPSMDAGSWADRERRFTVKFEAGRRFIPEIFSGFGELPELEQIAVFVIGSGKTHTSIAGGKLVHVRELMNEIKQDVQTRRVETLRYLSSS